MARTALSHPKITTRSPQQVLMGPGEQHPPGNVRAVRVRPCERGRPRGHPGEWSCGGGITVYPARGGRGCHPRPSGPAGHRPSKPRSPPTASSQPPETTVNDDRALSLATTMPISSRLISARISTSKVATAPFSRQARAAANGHLTMATHVAGIAEKSLREEGIPALFEVGQGHRVIDVTQSVRVASRLGNADKRTRPFC